MPITAYIITVENRKMGPSQNRERPCCSAQMNASRKARKAATKIASRRWIRRA